MQLSSLRENEKLTVFVSGRVDTKTAPELEKYTAQNIAGITELIFDLAGVTYISSAGLRAFLQAHKDMQKQGSMKLINISDDVMEIFDMIGFSNIFTIE
ncbi:MAG: STAS domain-containing protein [Clostridia bacterium]|nr:STAS domain-containing protein [Clostridia bacterium]